MGLWRLWVLRSVVVVAVALAADDSAPPNTAAANQPTPEMVEQSLKMLGNPQLVDHMRVMMQDPAVKERMKRMVAKLGPDAVGPMGALASGGDEAVDKLFERMESALKDPDVVEKMQAMAKSDEFQKRVQSMVKDPTFSSAASEYVEESVDEMRSDMEDVYGEAGLGDGLPDEVEAGLADDE